MKPLSLKIANGMTLHVSKHFMTNGHWLLMPEALKAIAITVDLSSNVEAFVINGRGKISRSHESHLTHERVKKIIAAADAGEYETVQAISEENSQVVLRGKNVSAVVHKKYLPFIERLVDMFAADGCEWQINKVTPLSALRFTVNDKTVALLMPMR